ncbi:MAG: LysR substrate-binding domain-containing protein, partial [Gammaproteobacteria bacterium]
AFTVYKEMYPEVMIEMLLTDRTPDLFGEEGNDLAIYLDKPDDSTRIARKLASTRIVVCGAPDYFAKKGTPDIPFDLTQHNCLTLSHHRSSFSGWKFIIDGRKKHYTQREI